MTSDHQDRTERRRLTVLAAALILMAAIIVVRLVYYQLVIHARLETEVLAQREREIEIPAERGMILDATGHPLAISLVQWTISVSPPLVTNRDMVATQLAEILQLSSEELYAKLKSGQPWFPIADHVSQEVGEAIVALKLSGVTCQAEPLRVYPEGPLAAHAIGIVNDTGVGYYGVEGYYNQGLKGVAGKREFEQSPAGAELPLEPQAQTLPEDGVNLVLTLDRNVQLIADQELKRAVKEYEAESGTVVIMDPKTGAILAIANYPSYDPTEFGGNLDLLVDPAVSTIWEPGSIFKIITWAGGLDSGTISPDTTIYDSGAREVGGRIIHNWDYQGRGDVTMTDGLAQSLNTVAAYISTSMGRDTFYTYLRRFGFGSLTGVDLDSEVPGLLRLPGDPDWFPSDLGTNAFGQGIAVTPVQMTAAVSAVANNGLLMKPHIVKQFVTQDQVDSVEPMALRQAISQETADTLKDMLVEVVAREAKMAQVPGYRIAGKTGTAQIPTAYGYDPDATIVSFIGFAPADDPRFVVLVRLERPKVSPWANNTAAPAFKAIAERLLVYMQIPPDNVRAATQGQ